ncbi:MAG: hypothetical protein K9J38_10295 [Polynucleobacter sp.]|nr:hypothetical protein [Polynucleobacter sp.]
METTPVLFLTYNRLDTATAVFEAIRKYKPQELYFVSNAPRPNDTTDKERVLRVREILNAVDWECRVIKLIRDDHLPVRESIATAIDWFFDQVECGVILEDDVVPDQAFFSFCHRLLDKYKDDSRIMMITGFNPFGGHIESNQYFYSENPSIWGWATWRERWHLYDLNMDAWPNPSFLNYLSKKFPTKIQKYYKNAFDGVWSRKSNTWDYQWTYTILSNYGLVIKPFANLISNIGVLGQHSIVRDENHFISYGKLNVDLLDGPKGMIPDVTQDYWFYDKKIKNKLFLGMASTTLKKIGLHKFVKRLIL